MFTPEIAINLWNIEFISEFFILFTVQLINSHWRVLFFTSQSDSVVLQNTFQVLQVKTNRGKTTSHVWGLIITSLSPFHKIRTKLYLISCTTSFIFLYQRLTQLPSKSPYAPLPWQHTFQSSHFESIDEKVQSSYCDFIRKTIQTRKSLFICYIGI